MHKIPARGGMVSLISQDSVGCNEFFPDASPIGSML